MIKMRKILLIILVFSLLLTNTDAIQTLGPDLTIESVIMSPFPVTPGEEFDLLVELKNSNTRKTIKELEFSLDDGYPFKAVSNNVKIASLEPNKKIVVTFRISTDKNAVNGVNTLRLVYEDSTDIKYVSKELLIDVLSNTKDLSIISVRTLPREIVPGSEINAVVTLKNMVNVLMKEIEVDLDLSGDVPFTPIGSTTKKTLNSLNSGEEHDFIFDISVDADAESKVHKIPLIIKYSDEFSKNYTIDTITGFKVATRPKLDYSIDSSEVYSSGKNGNVVIKVVNSGLADVKFLNVELLKTEDYEIISVPNVYLGNLESDDYETAEFKIYANSRKEVPLKLKVNYKDAFNEDYETEEKLMLPLYSSSELIKYGLSGNGGVSTSISYLILVIFVYTFIVEWRKEKSIPKAFKNTVMSFLKFIKKIIKAIRIRTLTRILLRIILFFKEP